MANYRLDPTNGNDANDGTTWALAWKTITSGATAARIAPGDTIRIAKTPGPENTGVSGTFTEGGTTITLSAALTANIDLCESAWTASANVTAATDATNRREGTNSISLAIAAGFTTGKIGYKAITPTDYSMYNHIYFHIRPNAAVAANALTIKLCSDTVGDTPVNSFTIPYALTANYWHVIHAPIGGALGSAIQSVALYAETDPGTVTVNLDNVIAGNNFGLSSVVGKNDGFWWPIISIDGTTVTLGNNGTAGITTRQLTGVSETVAFWHCYDHHKILASESVQDSGTEGNPITFSGGWDTTSDTQTGLTILEAINNSFDILLYNGKGDISLTDIKFLHGQRQIYGSSSSGLVRPSLNNIDCIGSYYNESIGIWGTSSDIILTLSGDIRVIAGNSNNSGRHILFYLVAKVLSTANIYIYGGATTSYTGIEASTSYLKSTGTLNVQRCGQPLYAGADSYFASITSKYNLYGLASSYLSNAQIDLLTTASNSNGALYLYGNGATVCRILESNLGETTKSASAKCSEYTSFAIEKYQGVANRFMRFFAYGTHSDHITGGQSAGWAYGGSGISLYLNPSSQTRCLPVVWYMPVTSGVAVQVQIQVIKTAGTPTTTFSCKGAGITPIVDASVSLTTSWAQYASGSVTPTSDGWIRCELKAYDGATTGDIGLDSVTLSTWNSSTLGQMDKYFNGGMPLTLVDTGGAGGGGRPEFRGSNL